MFEFVSDLCPIVFHPSSIINQLNYDRYLGIVRYSHSSRNSPSSSSPLNSSIMNSIPAGAPPAESASEQVSKKHLALRGCNA